MKTMGFFPPEPKSGNKTVRRNRNHPKPEVSTGKCSWTQPGHSSREQVCLRLPGLHNSQPGDAGLLEPRPCSLEHWTLQLRGWLSTGSSPCTHYYSGKSVLCIWQLRHSQPSLSLLPPVYITQEGLADQDHVSVASRVPLRATQRNAVSHNIFDFHNRGRVSFQIHR